MARTFAKVVGEAMPVTPLTNVVRRDDHEAMTANEVSRLGYRPALDGLRALAIAAVLLFHTAAILPGGYLGVDLFFVLSGFLITTLLVEEHAQRGAISLRSFYKRRALRLLPALFVMLAVFLVVSMAVAIADERDSVKDLFGVVAGVGYFSNLAMTAEPMTRPMPEELRHLWSLAQEEQFYLLWPLLLVVLVRRPSRVAIALVGAGVVAISSWQLVLYMRGASWERLGFAPDSRMLPIVVGCFLALVLARAPRSWVAHVRWLTPLAVACVATLLLAPEVRWLFPGPLLAYSLACATLIVVALDERSVVARLLSLSPLVFLGVISYSLYLWHFPVFVVVGLNDLSVDHAVLPSLGALVATFALATASYYFVELPFLRRKRRVARTSAETDGERSWTAPRTADPQATGV